MDNPYEVTTEHTSPPYEPPAFWWWPIPVGVVVTPFTCAMAVLSHGLGHGDGFADKVLFPLNVWLPLGSVDKN